jgi:RNA polymerase sigma-70 factor (ECF subfamily)
MEKIKTGDNLLLDLLRDESKRKEGMAILIHSYQERLYWLIRKMVINHDDSKDVLQEVLFRVWRNVHQFKGDSTLQSWLYRIASNEAFRFLEKKRRNLKHRMSMQEMLTKELETAPFISGEEIQYSLQKAILDLTDRQRLVFNMHYFDELDYREISAILETTVNNVKVLYHKAKTRIEEKIKEEI